jgi:spore germination cell wall hydrolase CwlJ-like protein
MNMVLAGLSTAASAQSPSQLAIYLNTVATRIDAGNLRDLAARVRAPRIDVTCMAAALYHEARGEITTGQLAVARVILNRVRSKVYPNSICGVVYENAHKHKRCQFSFACDGRPDYPRNAKSYGEMVSLAHAVLDRSGTDLLLPTNPSEYRTGNFDEITHYHTTAVNPFWAAKIKTIGQIGNHIFYRSDRVARSL